MDILDLKVNEDVQLGYCVVKLLDCDKAIKYLQYDENIDDELKEYFYNHIYTDIDWLADTFNDLLLNPVTIKSEVV